MITHPFLLDLLKNWKLSEDQNIPKDLLALLVHDSRNVTTGGLYELLYKYKKIKPKKKECIEIIKTHLLDFFNKENNNYKLKNNDLLSVQSIKLLNTVTCKNKSKNGFLEFYRNLSTEENFDLSLATKIIYKLFKQLKQRDVDTKKIMSNIIKSNLINESSKQHNDSSILNFVSKRKKLEDTNLTRFIPLKSSDTVYIYNLKNPNFRSLRRRNNLHNPVKKIYINLSSDFKLPIYKISEIQMKCKNSLQKIVNVDYDEESTVEDHIDEEDICSDDSETDSEDSTDEEWVETESDEQDTTRVQKRPMLIFPSIKCTVNEEFDENWNYLTLEKIDFLSEEFLQHSKSLDLANYVNLYKNCDLQNKINDFNLYIKKLSNRFMINEKIVEQHVRSKIINER